MITLPMWQNLARMGGYYEKLGFRDLPQPWFASLEAIRVTLPPDRTPHMLSDWDIFVGSAEQAFIDRMFTREMQPGRWQAITPCFRQEPVYDELHRPYFMKLELIEYMPSDAIAALTMMLWQVREALTTLLPVGSPEVMVEKTEIGWDLTLRGEEIGSYGIRELAGHQWVYGTGIAEPRFTTLLERVSK